MRKIRRLGVKAVMTPTDVRAMHRAGLNPEDVGEETGKVSASVYYAALRELEAMKRQHAIYHSEL